VQKNNKINDPQSDPINPLIANIVTKYRHGPHGVRPLIVDFVPDLEINNQRPDPMHPRYKDGTVKRFEVQSKTDSPAVLRSRNSALDQQLINQGFKPTPPIVVQPCP